MTVSNREARLNARRQTTCTPGYCLAYTRTWLGIPSRYPSAAVAWAEATGKHPGDRNPPPGVPMFWTGGSRGYGHVALSLYSRPGRPTRVRSTDVESSGQVGTVPLGWFDDHWPSLRYAGWAESLNGVRVDMPGGES